MKAVLFFLFILFSLTCLVSQTKAQENPNEFLFDFLPGSYTVIGRQPDSEILYQGTMIITAQEQQFIITRVINGDSVTVVGKLGTATTDSVPVLKVGFEQNGRLYEITYLIHSDLDNYARLTGYWYLGQGKTKKPGLEAAFAKQW